MKDERDESTIKGSFDFSSTSNIKDVKTSDVVNDQQLDFSQNRKTDFQCPTTAAMATVASFDVYLLLILVAAPQRSSSKGFFFWGGGKSYQ